MEFPRQKYHKVWLCSINPPKKVFIHEYISARFFANFYSLSSLSSFQYNNVIPFTSFYHLASSSFGEFQREIDFIIIKNDARFKIFFITMSLRNKKRSNGHSRYFDYSLLHWISRDDSKEKRKNCCKMLKWNIYVWILLFKFEQWIENVGVISTRETHKIHVFIIAPSATISKKYVQRVGEVRDSCLN